MKFSGVTILQGVEFSIFLLIFEWALQQCSATALPVIHKAKEIIFHRPAARNCSIPPPVPGIERVKQASLLRIDVTDTLSTTAYIDRLLMQVNQRLYLLSLLQSSGLQRSSLHLLFNTLVINKLTYALPAYAGQLTVDDKNRINAISRKAMRRGLTLTAFDIDTLIDKSGRKLFWQATNPGHSLHRLLPKTSSCSLPAS